MAPTIGQRLTDANNGAEFVTNQVDSADIILGDKYDPAFQTPRDSDYLVLADGDYVTVAFDEKVTDRPSDVLLSRIRGLLIELASIGTRKSGLACLVLLFSVYWRTSLDFAIWFGGIPNAI